LKNQFEPSSRITIGNRNISDSDPVYFIAEIGSNYDGDLNRAKDLIYMAKEAGAEAAKFQHYTANSLVSDFGFQKLGNSKSHQSSWKKSVYETYNDASINHEWTGVLHETCKEVGLSFFTSPYSFNLVDLVDEYVPAHKIGSGDITWIEIIEHIAKKGKPVLLATGASELVDVQRAVNAILNISGDLILLQCNTNYTAQSENYKSMQLKVIQRYQNIYPGIITGLSDHMPGFTAVLGSVALGAKVIEKHFTDSTERVGPDHSFSMTPETFREMVDQTRNLEDALGSREKRVEINEKETAILQRRSICASMPLLEGTLLERKHINVLRPCPENAIPPYELEKIMGKVLTRNIETGEQINWKDLD
jgi:sialic acid synthase SpsE